MEIDLQPEAQSPQGFEDLPPPNSEPRTPNCSITSRERKGTILHKAYFGCLDGVPTINITNGCLFQCVYCYARGYSQAPRKGEVQVYTNLPRLLKQELSRKRVFPEWVVINTSSDCFQPYPEILNTAYEVMEILLEHGIGISLLTKGEIPTRFIRLFGHFPGQILAQVGLVSFSGRYWKRYEPQTPDPALRLVNVQRLASIGIIPEIRMDPMVPFLTDGEDELAIHFRKVASAGVKRATLSYLHLRPAVEEQLMKELPAVHRKFVEACYGNQQWETVGSATRTKLLPKIIREKGYARIQGMAREFGISTVVCRCKNPDLPAGLCGSGRTKKPADQKKSCAQLSLFP